MENSQLLSLFDCEIWKSLHSHSGVKRSHFFYLTHLLYFPSCAGTFNVILFLIVSTCFFLGRFLRCFGFRPGIWKFEKNVTIATELLYGLLQLFIFVRWRLDYFGRLSRLHSRLKRFHNVPNSKCNGEANHILYNCTNKYRRVFLLWMLLNYL